MGEILRIVGVAIVFVAAMTILGLIFEPEKTAKQLAVTAQSVSTSVHSIRDAFH